MVDLKIKIIVESYRVSPKNIKPKGRIPLYTWGLWFIKILPGLIMFSSMRENKSERGHAHASSSYITMETSDNTL